MRVLGGLGALVHFLAFSQDGHALFVASDGLWDAFSDDDAGEELPGLEKRSSSTFVPLFLYFVAPLLVGKLEYLRIIGKSDAELLVASNQFGTNTYNGDGPILMWPATVLRPLFGEYRSMKILNPVSINLCGLRCLIFAPKLQHMILIEYALGLSLH